MTFMFSDPEKHELWQVLLRLNDCWTTPDGNPERLAEFFHENMVAVTPTDRRRLEGREACVSGRVGFTKTASIQRWEEHEPRIDVYGNSAKKDLKNYQAAERSGRRAR